MWVPGSGIEGVSGINRAVLWTCMDECYEFLCFASIPSAFREISHRWCLRWPRPTFIYECGLLRTQGRESLSRPGTL
eukprot:5735660-Amphidinium_carterae.1